MAQGRRPQVFIEHETTSLKYLNGEILERFKIRIHRPIKRRYVYEETYSEIMQWGSSAVRNGLIKRPKNNANNFPYFLEQYIACQVKKFET